VNGNILLIRLRSMGDIVLTLPAVHALREKFPGARITFLTSRQNAALLGGFREVDEMITLDYARYRGGNPIAIITETFALLRRLRAGRFSLVVDFQGYAETAWLTRLSSAPQRWGTLYRRSRRWAYTCGVAHNSLMHPAEWNLSLLKECGLRPGKILNEFTLPDSAVAEARHLFSAMGLGTAHPVLFIQPFTSWTPKNWPLDLYLAVARHWQKRGVQTLFGGGPTEQAALQPVRQAGFPVAAGNPLLVTAGLMKLASLILGGDTGMLHLAVAMNKRVLMIIGSLDPGRPYPFQHPDWTITPQKRQPVSSLSTEAVIEASTRAFAALDLGAALSDPRSSEPA
jgi:ADP-heptose:LPS heptosyltransferase